MRCPYCHHACAGIYSTKSAACRHQQLSDFDFPSPPHLSGPVAMQVAGSQERLDPFKERVTADDQAKDQDLDQQQPPLKPAGYPLQPAQPRQPGADSPPSPRGEAGGRGGVPNPLDYRAPFGNVLGCDHKPGPASCLAAYSRSQRHPRNHWLTIASLGSSRQTQQATSCLSQACRCLTVCCCQRR